MAFADITPAGKHPDMPVLFAEGSVPFPYRRTTAV